jgi:hypothetical protein
MNKHHITIAEAKKLPVGETIKWLKDNKYYRKAKDGVFDELTFKPISESECECLTGNSNMFCCMPCPTIKDLYIVESDNE